MWTNRISLEPDGTRLVMLSGSLGRFRAVGEMALIATDPDVNLVKLACRANGRDVLSSLGVESLRSALEYVRQIRTDDPAAVIAERCLRRGLETLESTMRVSDLEEIAAGRTLEEHIVETVERGMDP